MPMQISVTTEINASPEHVWAVLADLPSYPEWHPVYRAVTGELAAGGTLTITSTHPATGRPLTAKVKVRAADPASELCWVSSLPILMKNVHSFILTPEGGGTRLEQIETYRPSFGRSTSKIVERIQSTFETINEAIKQQAEARQRASG